MMNRLITRGMGTSRGEPGRAGMLSRGMGGIPTELMRRLRAGGKSARVELERAFEDVIVWAKLVRVNDRKPREEVIGHVVVRHSLVSRVRATAETVTDGVRSLARELFARAKFLRKR